MTGRLVAVALLMVPGITGGCASVTDESSAEAVAPVWAPDGDSIAYVHRERAVERPDATVRVIDVAQERDRELIEGAGWHAEVAWSPDGRWLALPSERDRRRGRSCWSPPCDVLPELYLVSRDGSRTRRLTNNHADDFAPVWSPDGRRLAFISGRDRPAGVRTWRDVYVSDLQRGGLVRLTNDGASEAALFWREPGRLEVERDDGTRLAISPETRRRTSLRRLGSGRRTVAPRTHAVAWLSTKDRNGETCYADSEAKTCWANTEVYLRAPGARAVRVTRTTSDEGYLAWSPDGRLLAFSSGGQIWIVDATGSGLRKISG